MHKTAGIAQAFVIVMLTAGCGDDAAQGGAGASTQSTGGAGNGGSPSNGGGGSTGAIGSCEMACMPPQFCSAAGQCIDEGTCLDDADCERRGTICDETTQACVPGGGCEDFEAGIMPVPPNLLLVLDRSCSMTDPGGGGLTKWEAAVGGITTLTTTYADEIRFGITLFPDTVSPNCAQDTIPIPPAPANEPAIQTLLQNALVNADPNFPDGPCVTNIDTAMEQASLAPELTDMTRANFAALITDGMQAGCSLAGGDAGTLQIITDMLAAGIPTFVVGFGNGVDPAQLDEFAIAGGVPNTSPSYYDASDQASLEAALDIIATATISCTFTLDTDPPAPDEIYVFFDDVPIDSDPTMMNGWSYDETTNQITFHGADCDALKNGDVMQVSVVLGCGGPT